MHETAFGPFTFDFVTGELFRDHSPVALPPKATLVLRVLLSSPGRLISHEKLYEAAWNGTVVEFDQGLYTCIRQIRNALGDDARNPRYIETVPRRGYRFCYPLSNVQARKHRWPAGLSFQAAAIAATTLLLFFSVVILLSGQARMPAPSDAHIALGDFRIEGFDVSTGGIDHQLEVSVRNGLAAQGIKPDRTQPSYVLTGLITPARDGALFHASLVRLSDGETIWQGDYNPFCPEVPGEPIPLIGRLVARTVVARVSRRSA